MLRSIRHLLLAGTVLFVGRHASGVDVAASAPNNVAQCWFGVAVENIPPAIAKQLKLQPRQGLMVMAIMPDSPAEKSGLKPDDLLIELNGVPLMSQIELANAANTIDSSSQPCKSHITYLHNGDRVTIDLAPAPRPLNMLVLGGNLGNFIPQQRDSSKGGPNQPSHFQTAGQNYFLPNGSAAQVGPGYRMDLSGSDGSSLAVKSIKAIVGRGQTIVLSQETDPSGNLHSTISVGGKLYPVEASSGFAARGSSASRPATSAKPLPQRSHPPCPPIHSNSASKTSKRVTKNSVGNFPT